MYSEEVSSAPGSVSQVRESTNVFMQLAKGLCIPIFIVGHVTKEGTVAGPRVLEHMVDTVLYFEGDRHASYRILRAVKNRFGSTNEIGVFEMRQSGLEEVENPSEYMLSGRPEQSAGSVVACSMEGTRPILIEIQALVCRSNFGMPRRTAAGTDYNRVNLLMAVLEKRLGMALSNSDAYVNIAGGIRMNEPAIDLGIVMALVSSYRNRPVDEKDDRVRGSRTKRRSPRGQYARTKSRRGEKAGIRDVYSSAGVHENGKRYQRNSTHRGKKRKRGGRDDISACS